jgi:hypothetical protein
MAALRRALAFLGSEFGRLLDQSRRIGTAEPATLPESRRSERRLRHQATIRLTCRRGPNGGCECVRRAHVRREPKLFLERLRASRGIYHHDLALMFPVKGEGVLVGLLADGEQCKLLKLHKAGDGAVDDG